MTEWPKKTLTGLKKTAEHPVCIQIPQTGIYPLQPLLYDVGKGTSPPLANGEQSRPSRHVPKENTDWAKKNCRASCLHTNSTNRHLPTSAPSI